MTEKQEQQVLFNHVVEGLAAQGFHRSEGVRADGRFDCLYRGAEGMKCAYGQLIDDALYLPALEGANTLGIAERLNPTIEPDFQLLIKHKEFLRSLQFSHDVAYDPLGMRQYLRSFAAKHGLTTPAVLDPSGD